MTKAVLLDLNGVVEDTSSFVTNRDEIIAATVSSLAPLDLVQQKVRDIREKYFHVMPNGIAEFHLAFWDDLLLSLDLISPGDEETLMKTFDIFVTKYLPTSRVFPDARLALEQLHTSIDFGVLSNANSLRARRFLKFHDLLSFAKAIVVSHDTPYAKPCPELFLLAAQRLGRRPEEVIMIGDRIDNDVIGAIEAGLSPVLIDRAAPTLPEGSDYAVIPSLTEIPCLIQSNSVHSEPLSVATGDKTPKAVIVCGGAGTRLKEKSGALNKCLAPIDGKPMLAHVIKRLRKAGVTQFDLLAGQSQQQIQDGIAPYAKDLGCTINVLPIGEPGTGKTMQEYWKRNAPGTRDILYSHGNVLVEPHLVRDFVLRSQSNVNKDIVILSSPLWAAQTHASVIPKRGLVERIVVDASADNRALCSVGLIFVRGAVPLPRGAVSEKGMFEELVEDLRLRHSVKVAYQYMDTPWDHLGVPADWDRLVAHAS